MWVREHRGAPREVQFIGLREDLAVPPHLTGDCPPWDTPGSGPPCKPLSSLHAGPGHGGGDGARAGARLGFLERKIPPTGCLPPPPPGTRRPGYRAPPGPPRSWARAPRLLVLQLEGGLLGLSPVRPYTPTLSLSPRPLQTLSPRPRLPGAPSLGLGAATAEGPAA